MQNYIRISLLAFFSASLLSACLPGTSVVTPAPDVIPPTVLSTSPAEAAVGVTASVVINAVFDENMDASTINDSSFTLSDGVDPVAGTVAYSGKTATFTPSVNLANTTTYTATISSVVQDIAGNAMSVDKTWTFTTQGWLSKAAIPSTSYGLGGAVVAGKFYAISGYATARLGIYDPLTDIWSTGASLPSGLRQFFGTAVIGDKIYVVGGDTGGSGDRDTLFCYDTTLNTWTTLAPMPLGSRYGLGAVAIDGKIYAVGGYNIGSATYLDRLEVYDPGTGVWTTKTSMPTARISPLVGVINGKLLVAGGSNGTSLSVLEVYNPVTDSWATGSSMPYAGGFDGAVVGNKLYALGGGATPYNRVFAYDATKNAWITNFDTMPSGRWAIGVAADADNNKIYAVGGWNGAYSSALEVFSPPLP